MLNSFLFWFVAAGIRRCRPGQRPMQTAPAFAARVARALQRRRLYRVLLRGFRVTTLLAAPNHGRESAHVWIPPARGSPLPAAAGALPRTAAPDNGGRPGRRYCPPRRGSHRLLAGEDPLRALLPPRTTGGFLGAVLQKGHCPGHCICLMKLHIYSTPFRCFCQFRLHISEFCRFGQHFVQIIWIKCEHCSLFSRSCCTFMQSAPPGWMQARYNPAL